MIDTEKDNRKLVERAILIGVQDENTTAIEAQEHLEELEELVDGTGIPVISSKIIILKKISSKYLMGTGKAEEINNLIIDLEADCIIFDYEISPSQQRNWERLTKICVVDRQEIILDIFANRASTREAVLQVEVARMVYALPRLTRAWTHLSRQKGGVKGSRGEGEQQIEIDRRLVKDKIRKLKLELTEVQSQRKTQRKYRAKTTTPHCAIVGYTNAGKSSLLNRLCGSEVLVEDKLFATLDPTTRKISLPNNQDLLITDTVGFVRKLPHALVEAFKSTLEEAVLADFLIIVLDASSHHIEDHWETTISVLTELNANDKKKIVLFNKIDKISDEEKEELKNLEIENVIFMSIYDEVGISELIELLVEETNKNKIEIKISVPPTRYEIISLAHRNANVLHSDYDDDANNLLSLSINPQLKSAFKDFIIED